MSEFSFSKELSEFKKFYNSLSNTDNLFYMFFTTDLLFWVKKSLSFIPGDVNLVLIGAGLRDNEILWINNNSDRPFFHITGYCDDREAWALLFQTNKKNFGWLDVDCFVLNPKLFKEIIEIEEDVAINCVWSYKDSNSNYEFLNTYFLYINMEVLNAIRKRNIEITPYTYIYEEADTVTFTKSNILKSEHLEIIQQYFSENTYPAGVNFFDTLLVYQMIAEHYGYRLKKIRQLNFNNYLSDEAVHVGGGSIFSTPMYDNINNFTIRFMTDDSMISKRIMCYIQTYLVLHQVLASLPCEYKRREEIIIEELKKAGIKPEDFTPFCIKFFKRNHLSEEAIHKLLEWKEALV